MLRTAVSTLQHASSNVASAGGSAFVLREQTKQQVPLTQPSMILHDEKMDAKERIAAQRAKKHPSATTATISATPTVGTTYSASLLQGTFVSVAMDATGNYVGATSINENYGVFISTNAGMSYTLTSTILASDIAIAANTPKYMLLAANTGLFTSTNTGATFTSATFAAGNTPTYYSNWLECTINGNGQYAYAISQDSTTTPFTITLYASTDNLATFHRLNNAPNNTLYTDITTSTDGNYLYVINSNNYNVFISTNHGSSWSSVSVGTPIIDVELYQIATNSNGQYVAILSDGGFLYLSNNYGQTWKGLYDSYFHAISMSGSGQYVYAASLYGNLWVSNNYGYNYTVTQSPPSSYAALATTANANMTVAVSNDGSIFMTMNNGASWTPNHYDWADVAMSQNGLTIAAISGNEELPGFLSLSNNAGVTWQQAGYYGTLYNSYVGIACDATCTNMIVSNPGYEMLFVTSDSGSEWSKSYIAASDYYTYTGGALAMSSNGVYATYVATGGRLFYSTNGGMVWTAAIIPANVEYTSLAMSYSGQIQYASANGAYVYTSTDYGVTWARAGNIAISGWLSVSCSSNGLYVLTGANGGSLYLSTNSGGTWSSTSAPTGSWMATAVSSSGQYMYAATSGQSSGMIYASSNYGVTWTKVSTPAYNYRSLACSSTGQYVTAVSWSGPVVVSTNYGSSWTTENVPFSTINDFGTFDWNWDDDWDIQVLSGGAIAGIVIGIIAFCCCCGALIGVFFFGLCQKKDTLINKNNDVPNDAL